MHSCRDAYACIGTRKDAGGAHGVAYSPRRFITRRPASRRCRLGMSNDTFARMRGVSRSPDTPRSRNRTAGAVVPNGNTAVAGVSSHRVESSRTVPCRVLRRRESSLREFLALMQMRAVVHFVVHGAVVVLRWIIYGSLRRAPGCSTHLRDRFRRFDQACPPAGRRMTAAI